MDSKRVLTVEGPSLAKRLVAVPRTLKRNFVEAKEEIEDKPRSRARILTPFKTLIKPGQQFDGPAQPTQVITGHGYRYWTDGSHRRDFPKPNKAARKALKRLVQKEREARRAEASKGQ